MNRIFLSASIQPPGAYTPQPEPRDADRVPPLREGAYDTDRLAIRECTLLLLAEALKHHDVCFGGHPHISPFVLRAADSLGRRRQVHIYQARYFEPDMPEEHRGFENFEWDEGLTWTREERDRLSKEEKSRAMQASLAGMRDKMLGSNQQYQAGFFLGGKEGVVHEWDAFAQKHPQALLFPVGSTGGAARFLWETKRRECLKSWGRATLAADGGERLYELLGASRRYRGVILSAFDLITSSPYPENAGPARASR